MIAPAPNKARCRECGRAADGGWAQCPEDAVFRELLLEAGSGYYVDAHTKPRYVLYPEEADGRIICARCEDRRAPE